MARYQANEHSRLVREATDDSEDSELSGLEDTRTRHGFVQKVYGILFTQLLVTTGIGALIMSVGKHWVAQHRGLTMTLLILSLIGTIGVNCVWICNPETMRESPTNYILLGVFTFAQSVLVGFISVNYTQESVLMVLGVTAVVVLSLTLFACQTTYDFSGYAPYAFVAVMILCSFGFILSIASMTGAANSPAFKTLHLIYAGIGALLFSFFIVIDTQMIVGDKHHQFRISVDDYCMAAIVLYTDIIQLFLFLLQLFGDRK
eukprot:TRINITY_DN1633_c2_g1_i1.p1 TRINITY_DN1633_c2_g1~~TRINITY_DN1633_c2_g1_i1.p1  ORF type:complete len:260 (-),score=14.89 TRINITY_DN1633_c2_g1_i1:187-966(-)